ncbi:hypothetical protein [Spirosoma litoris]
MRTWYFPPEKFIDSSLTRVRVPKDQVTESMRTDPNYYFLPGELVLASRVKTRIDTFKLNWFSYDLYKLREPVLSNFPLEKEVYRFTLLRSFHPPVVISLEKKGDKIRLYSKVARKMPEFPGRNYMSRNGKIHIADSTSQIPFKVNKSKRLSKATYDEFIQLMMSLKVLYSSPLGFSKVLGTDGSELILETHRPDGYYFLVRWSPNLDQPIRIIGNYLLNLSDAHEIPY